MKQAIIDTSFGQIRISYDSGDELGAALERITDEVRAIDETAKQIVPTRIREPKPGYERIYRFTSDGDLELLRVPPLKKDAVALALYAFHPDYASSEQLKASTSIEKIAQNVISTGDNKRYFKKIDDGYGLTFEGLRLVTETIFPQLTTLPNPTKTEQEES